MVVAGLKMVGREFDGAFEGGERACKIAGGAARLTQIEVIFGALGSEGDSLLQIGSCL